MHRPPLTTFFFFFNDTATTEIYTLSLHDALPIYHPWSGMFFAYDRTGKELLLAKAILRLRSQEKEPPKISPVTIAGSPVLKIERKNDVTYWGEHGKYAVSAADPGVFEEIAARLDGKAAAGSLAQTAPYPLPR